MLIWEVELAVVSIYLCKTLTLVTSKCCTFTRINQELNIMHYMCSTGLPSFLSTRGDSSSRNTNYIKHNLLFVSTSSICK